MCKLAIVLLLSSAATAGCFAVRREVARDPKDLLRVAVDNTFALTRIKVVEQMAFPSSAELLSSREARTLGTGVWSRVIELEAPDRAHYLSSSEERSLEAYRVGRSVVYRITSLGTQQDDGGTWHRVASVEDIDDEEVRSELRWLCGVTGVEAVVDGGLRDAKSVSKIGEEQIDGVRYAVLVLEVPGWFQRFERSLEEGAVPATPVKYEVKAWVTSRGEPLLHKIEDMYVHHEPDSRLYQYVVGTRVFEPAPELTIGLP